MPTSLQTGYLRLRRYRALSHHEAIETLALAHDASMVDIEQRLEADYREDMPDGMVRDWRRPRLRRKKESR